MSATPPRPRLLLLFVSMVGAASACAGARVTVVADRAAYPISMSDCVRDSSGRLYDRRELVTVGKLRSEHTRAGFLYSTLTAGARIDISDEVNGQVTAARGEAVVGLDVTVGPDCSLLNEFPVLTILPIWPGCIPVTITGDIVRRRTLPPPPQQ